MVNILIKLFHVALSFRKTSLKGFANPKFQKTHETTAHIDLHKVFTELQFDTIFKIAINCGKYGFRKMCFGDGDNFCKAFADAQFHKCRPNLEVRSFFKNCSHPENFQSSLKLFWWMHSNHHHHYYQQSFLPKMWDTL